MPLTSKAENSGLLPKNRYSEFPFDLGLEESWSVFSLPRAS